MKILCMVCATPRIFSLYFFLLQRILGFRKAIVFSLHNRASILVTSLRPNFHHSSLFCHWVYNGLSRKFCKASSSPRILQILLSIHQCNRVSIVVLLNIYCYITLFTGTRARSPSHIPVKGGGKGPQFFRWRGPRAGQAAVPVQQAPHPTRPGTGLLPTPR